MTFLKQLMKIAHWQQFRRRSWEPGRMLYVDWNGQLHWSDCGVTPEFLGTNPAFDLLVEDARADDWEVIV